MSDDTEEVEAEQTTEITADEAWQDINLEEDGQAPDEFQEMELSDGKPVLAKYVQEGAIQRYKKQIRARHDNISEEEVGERVVVKILQEHYKQPDLSFLTYQKYKDSKMGYYDKFLDPIAPELANQAQNL